MIILRWVTSSPRCQLVDNLWTICGQLWNFLRIKSFLESLILTLVLGGASGGILYGFFKLLFISIGDFCGEDAPRCAGVGYSFEPKRPQTLVFFCGFPQFPSEEGVVIFLGGYMPRVFPSLWRSIKLMMAIVKVHSERP